MARLQIRRKESIQVDRIFLSPNVFGKTVYLDVTNGDANNGGTDPKDAVLTIKQALAVSLLWDTLCFAPGTYPVDVSDASQAPLAYQHWVAAVPAEGGAPSVIIVADADDNVNTPVAVDVDGVTFEGIEFKLVAGGTTALYMVEAAQTTAVRGLKFLDCWFNMNSVDGSGVIGVRFNDASNAITGFVMKKCRLTGNDATTNQGIGIAIGVQGIPGALIEDNIFEVQSNDGDARAFSFSDPGAAVKSYGMTIRNNDFIGPSDGGGDGVPIAFNGSMTEDEIVGIIRTNYFSNCTIAPITVDKVNNSIVLNYNGDDATGGTLVDPGT